MNTPPRIQAGLARRLDRLARRAHAFHRFAHHPLCREYEGEVFRLGRRVRICRGCALASTGALAGLLAGIAVAQAALLAAPMPPIAAALALVPGRARTLGKVGRRLLPAGLLSFAAVSGLRSGGAAGLALLLGAFATAAILNLLYRRSGPDRGPCAACPERSGSKACRGFAASARRERAFQRVAGSLLTSGSRGPALLVALAAGSLACGRSEPRPDRPNILVVSVDCLRADHLACYGYPRQTSPAIDSLAQDGVRFERAIAASGWTLSSHMSMLTGLPVSAHGVEDDRLWARVDAGGNPLPVPLRGVFVSEVLHEAGYATAGFFTVKWLERQFGFGPGFDTWERLGHTFNSHPVVGPIYRRIKAARDGAGLEELRRTYPELFDQGRPSTPETIDRAIGWLDEHRRTAIGQPFFLFLHLFDPHEPYNPPPPYDTLFETGSGDRELERMIAAYDGSIRAVDAEISRLLARIDTLGLRRNTLVVLTGDHGEEFEEHGHRSHRVQLFLENIRVPLVMRWPDGMPAGRVVRGNAGHVDIAPTLYAAAGARPKQPTLGTDLLPFARGEAENAPRTYAAELAFFGGSLVPTRHLTIVRGDEMRVLRCRGRSPWSGVRFDLAQNPEGRGPGDPLDLGGPEGTRLHSELAELRATFHRARAALPVRQEGVHPLTDHDREEIEAMGYAGDEESIFGQGSAERLFFDGGVWPDQ